MPYDRSKRPAQSVDKLIGLNLRQVRLQAGLGVEDVARRAGLTEDEVLRCEQGGTRITALLLVRLAHALEIQVTDLLTENPWHS